MKKTTIILAISLAFFGCSSRNAFDYFSITPKQELSENNIQSSKIKKGTTTIGTVSVVYLNEVYPKKYKDGEYFYIYTYVKDKRDKLRFELNELEPITVKELNSTNEFTHLSLSHVDWQKYYLVGFKEQGDMLKLLIKTGEFSSEPLLFEKDE